MKNIGIDLLGVSGYAKEAIKALDAFHKLRPDVKFYVGVIDTASEWDSGKAREFINKICTRNYVLGIRSNGLWLDNHGFGLSHLDQVKTIGRAISEIAQQNPTKHFLFAPTLEHQMNTALATKFKDDVSKVLTPGVTFVNSYIVGGARLNNTWNEVHHTLKSQEGKYSFSFDGLDQYNADVQKFKDNHAEAQIFFGWVFPFNMRYVGDKEKDATPRGKRKLIPPQKLIISMLMQLCVTQEENVKLPGDTLYKAYGEPCPQGDWNPPANNGTLNPRSCTMTYLSEYDGDTVTFNVKGKTLATFKNAGKEDHGKGPRNVFREVTNKWGVDVYLEVIKLKKNGLVNVLEGKTKVGQVNPLFRYGSFKNDA